MPGIVPLLTADPADPAPLPVPDCPACPAPPPSPPFPPLLAPPPPPPTVITIPPWWKNVAPPPLGVPPFGPSPYPLACPIFKTYSLFCCNVYLIVVTPP